MEVLGSNLARTPLCFSSPWFLYFCFVLFLFFLFFFCKEEGICSLIWRVKSEKERHVSGHKCPSPGSLFFLLFTSSQSHSTFFSLSLFLLFPFPSIETSLHTTKRLLGESAKAPFGQPIYPRLTGFDLISGVLLPSSSIVSRI